MVVASAGVFVDMLLDEAMNCGCKRKEEEGSERMLSAFRSWNESG